MAQHGTHDDAAPDLDSVGSLGSAQAETTTDSTATLLRRVTVLEDREHALNAELAALRADLGNLREHLHQALVVAGATEVVDSSTVGDSGPPAVGAEGAIDSPAGEALLADGTPVDEAEDQRVNSPASSDIDDLIQAAVASRGCDLEARVRPPEPAAADSAAFPEVALPDPPTAAEVKRSTATETTTPSESSAEDFFIGQSSPRRGRS